MEGMGKIKTMKRYLLFAGDNYYPTGGWEDFICDGDSIEELQALRSWGKDLYDWELKIDHARWLCESSSGQWLHIVDRDTAEIVLEESSYSKDNEARIVAE
jgi:hypothetical protein